MADSQSTRNALHQAQQLVSDSQAPSAAANTRGHDYLKELSLLRHSKNPLLLPEDPFAKSKLNTHYYLLNYLELGQSILVVGGVQKSYYQHLSAGKELPAHLKDNKSFFYFLRTDGVRQISDLVSRLTHES